MSSSAAKPPERYHHGDLKNALLDAAQALALEQGVDAFTLREVARRAGVSPGAPYHHFADRNDLVRGLAIRAFSTLALDLETARKSHKKPLAQLEAIGLAYVRFAFTHHGEFRFMFNRELCAPSGQPDPLADAGVDAQAVLYRAVVDAQASGDLRPGDPQAIALTLWSVVHGFSGIALETPTGKGWNLETALALAKGVIAGTLEGLKTKRV
jgi:AcrR family transcriptional regulator